MSKCVSTSSQPAPCQNRIDYLEARVDCFERQQKETDYVVLSLKAEIRLLRDTLSMIKMLLSMRWI